MRACCCASMQVRARCHKATNQCRRRPRKQPSPSGPSSFHSADFAIYMQVVSENSSSDPLAKENKTTIIVTDVRACACVVSVAAIGSEWEIESGANAQRSTAQYVLGQKRTQPMNCYPIANHRSPSCGCCSKCCRPPTVITFVTVRRPSL